MRHSLNYGLLNQVDLSDEKIKTALPKDALAELEKTGGSKTHPANYLIMQALENELDAGDQFTVNDLYILIHKDQEGIIVKMSTLRSSLSNLARREESPIDVAKMAGKHRIYVKK